MKRVRRLAVAFGLAIAACTTVPAIDAEPQTFVIDESPDPAMVEAEAEARSMWAAVGAVPPRVPVILGGPPLDYAGFCFCDTLAEAVIVVRYPRAELIAHELGHAMGLHHVHGDSRELMMATVTKDAVIGPATMAEAIRAGALTGADLRHARDALEWQMQRTEGSP